MNYEQEQEQLSATLVPATVSEDDVDAEVSCISSIISSSSSPSSSLSVSPVSPHTHSSPPLAPDFQLGAQPPHFEIFERDLQLLFNEM